MEERKAQSDPTPVMYEEEESVASTAESVKTRDLWNWHLPNVYIDHVTIPGWVILLGAVLFFRGPSTC